MNRKKLFVIACGLLVGLGQATPLRADNIDVALPSEAIKILDKLREGKYENVGVLKFRVKVGNKLPSWNVGPLNSNLTERLETVLVNKNETSAPIGIIHDASGVAGKAGLPPYTTSRGMNGLFNQRFPLSWDKKIVEPGAFLAGAVIVPPDMKTVRIELQLIDKNERRLKPFHEFTVPMDRNILEDLGRSFIVSSRSINKTRKFQSREEDLDKEAAQSAAKAEKPSTSTVPVKTNKPSTSTTPAKAENPSVPPDADKNIATVGGNDPTTTSSPAELKVLYDEMEQQMEDDPANSLGKMVKTPNPGQKVWLSVKNVSDQRIGFVLMVNGFSTYQEEKDSPDQCMRWVLEPGQTQILKGFYQDTEKYTPFKVLTDEEESAVLPDMSYRDKIGLINLAVFVSAQNGDKNIAEAGQPASDGPTTRSLRKATKELSNVQKRGLSLAQTQDAIRKTLQGSSKGVTKRNLVFKDEITVADKVVEDTFPNPTQKSNLTVRYYTPKN